MEPQMFLSSNPYPTHYRLDVPAAVNSAQETNVHFNLQNISVFWNVTPCSLVSVFQATSQKAIVFPVTIVRNPDFTYKIYRCCNFIFAMKLENKAIALVFLTVSLHWMYEKTVRIITYSRVGHQRPTASHPASLLFPAATDAISRLRNFDLWTDIWNHENCRNQSAKLLQSSALYFHSLKATFRRGSIAFFFWLSSICSTKWKYDIWLVSSVVFCAYTWIGREFITSFSCCNKKLNRGVKEISAGEMVALSVSKAFLLWKRTISGVVTWKSMTGRYSVYSSNRTIMRNTIIESYTKLPTYFALIQPCLEGYSKNKIGHWLIIS